MNKLLAFSVLFISACCAFAQADVKMWTKLAGTLRNDFCYAVAADHFGNAVIAGETTGSLGGPGAGNWDLYVVKFDAAGNQLWARQRGTEERDCIYGVTTDADGNVYATGYTGGPLDGNKHYGNLGTWDFFLMKFDASGNWQWTKMDGTGPNDEGRAICMDPAGNIFIAGYVRGNFDGNTQVGSADVFVRKYDAAGNRLWTRVFGSIEIDEAFGVTCDASGNVFVTGWCSESIEGIPYFANGDNFLAKFDSNGQRLWLKQWGTVHKDTGYSLGTDAAGNVYLSGYTTGQLYGPQLGERDIFFAKFDPDGNLIWAKQVGTSGHDQGWGLATLPSGDVYVAGETSGPLEGNVYAGGLDVFLTKYNSAGAKLWTMQMGTSSDDLGQGLAVATNGAVFLAGRTSGDLDGNVLIGLSDAFLMKFLPATNVPPFAPVALPAVAVTSNSFTARWITPGAATGCRLDVSTNSTFSDYLSGHQDQDVGNVTNHYVTGLIPATTYFYRVRAYNIYGTSDNSDVVTVTLAPATPCASTLNPDFEGGFGLEGGGYIANGWTEWEATPAAVVGYDETGIFHGGAHSQRIRVGSTNATSGGIYQRLPVTAGNTYDVGVWAYAGDSQSACSLGVDPSGGTNAGSAGIVWSSVTTNVAWVWKTWTGTATANLLTVFYRVASSDSIKRNGYFDDATPSDLALPLLTVQRNGSALILTWSACPPARLEQADSLTSPVGWSSATNEVGNAGGQRSTALTPAGEAGYYRLVLE